MLSWFRRDLQAEHYRRLLGYFAPLALQVIAQGITYPLVAMVAVRGSGGALNLAGLSQAHTIVALLLTLSPGFVTAGMVFGRTREGFARCQRLNSFLLATIVAVYGLLLLPPVAQTLFSRLLGLTPPVARPAYLAFAASLPMIVLAYLRNPFHIVLYNNNGTGRAFLAALGRIVLTLLLAPLFCVLRAVGPVCAVICLTLPMGAEVLINRVWARPLIRRLAPGAGRPPDYAELLMFTLALSVGAVFISLSGCMLGAFVARAANPERMLPIYYLALGVAGPVAGGALRTQALVINFHGQSARLNRELVNFTLAVGLGMGLLPLVFILPGLIEWYYLMLQKLPPADLPLVRAAAGVLIFFPLAVALRGYSEGRAAALRKPTAVLAGQAIYLAMAALAAFLMLSLGMPGHLLGPSALVLANLAAAGLIMFALAWEQRGHAPVSSMEVEQ